MFPERERETRVVEGGGFAGAGHKHNGEAVEPVHVLKIYAYLIEHDRGRGVVGVCQTPRGRACYVPKEVDEDDQVRGLRRDQSGGAFDYRRIEVCRDII